MKHFYFLAFALLAIAPGLFGQYAINGEAPFGNDISGASGDLIFTTSINGTQRFTVTTATNAERNFRLVTKNSSQQRVEVGPSGCDTNSGIGALDGSVITGQLNCTGSNAYFRTGGNVGTYVIKTPQANESGTFIFWRLSEPVREITSVTSSVSGETSPPQKSVIIAGRLGDESQTTNNGQTMYIRYSDDNFASSFVVAMVDNGNGTFTGNIPGEGLTEGETVKYYLFTSATGSSNPAVTADNADLRTITFNNNGGSNFSFLVTSAAPVTYSSWSGERAGNGVKLNWSTDSEVDAEHFTLERSAANGTEWMTVGRVEALNRPTGGDYAYTDLTAPSGQLQYRLRQVDFDGATHYSSILTVTTDLAAETALEVWPQPASASAIQMRATGLEGRTGQLYSATGRLVTSLRLTGQVQSLASLNLASGLYLLRVEGNTTTLTQRVLIR